MAEWRFGRGWTPDELEERVRRLESAERNFDLDPNEMSVEAGWNHYVSTARLAREPPGDPLPDGPFERAKVGIDNYEFSDPRIVTAHFDPEQPLLGRRMLLEIRVLGLRFLCGAVVGEVRAETGESGASYGFRYDTLEGHIERGAEWFILTKDRGTGEIRYRIEAYWRPGEFPNWWSRLGFHLVAHGRQREWHHRAQRRLHLLARYGDLTSPAPTSGHLVHEGPEVIFQARRGVDTRRGRGHLSTGSSGARS